MISLQVLIALFFSAVALAAFASLIHSLRYAWAKIGELAVASRHPHFDTVRVEWRDPSVVTGSKVVQLRPRTGRPLRSATPGELRAAA